MNNDEVNPAGTPADEPYEAPAIEEVVTPEKIEREVHYAGITPISQVPN